jgi:hypothetical protein
MKQKNKLVFTVIIGVAVAGIAIWSLTFFGDLYDDILPSSMILPSEYSNLISEKYRDSFQVVEIVNSKNRPPVAVLQINRFHLTINKINTVTNRSIEDILTDEFRRVGESSNTTYRNVNIEPNCHFLFKTGKEEKISRIFLALSGSSVRTLLSNDSIMTYHLNAEYISIRYDEDATTDIVIEPSATSKKSIPMELLLFKQGKVVYLLILYPDDIKEDFPGLSLYNLIQKAE